MPGQAAKMNSCMVCSPSSSTSVLSEAQEGTSCGTDIAPAYCSLGVCTQGCFIDSMVQGSGALDPSNPCMSCQPMMSGTTWTQVMNGSTCGEGACVDGVCAQLPCRKVITGELLNQPNTFGQAISVQYTMVGGGGGAGSAGPNGMNASDRAGGGGGSSAILCGSHVFVAMGSAGQLSSSVLLGAGPVTGTFTWNASDSLTVYVGGGGGGGGSNGTTNGGGGGGGAGYLGGGGGGTAGGGPGSMAGGLAGGDSAGDGTSLQGGGGGLAFGGAGGRESTGGGVVSTMVGGGGGGGALGGGGGVGGGGTLICGTGTGVASPGGDKGGSTSSCQGTGASTWGTATAFPPSAGASGNMQFAGGNAGLVVLTYYSPPFAARPAAPRTVEASRRR
jgi:hypothetical protein